MNAPRFTFRLRLAIHTMVVAGVLIAVFGVGAWWYAKRQLARNLDLRVTNDARQLWTELTPRHNSAAMQIAANSIFGTQALEDGSLAVLMQSHTPEYPVIYASAAAPDAGFPDHLAVGEGVISSANTPLPPENTPPAQRGNQFRPQMPEIRDPIFFTTRTDKGEWRYVALSSPRYTLFVGLSTNEYYADVSRATWSFIAVAAVGLLLAGLVAWWLAGRAMLPLKRVVATAEKLCAAELDERITVEASDDLEFSKLISSLNGMIERLHTSFQQAARFTADASHELKTPLAVMQATLHDALRSGESPAVEPLLIEVSRLKSITHSLLLLSQADAGKLPIQRERYDLSNQLEGIAEDADALCSEVGIECQHDIASGIEIDADPALMRHVFRNLLANAIHYNRPEGAVTMSLRREGEHAIFSITNTGKSIPLEVQPRLFERFFRADHARKRDGTGLGLNIAAELAKANSAEVRLESSHGDLTTLRVTVPLVSAST